MANQCSNEIFAVCSDSEFEEISKGINENLIEWPPSYYGVEFGKKTIDMTTRWSPTPLDEGYMKNLSIMYPSVFFDYQYQISEDDIDEVVFICGGKQYKKRQSAVKAFNNASQLEVQRFLDQETNDASGVAHSVKISDDGSVSADGLNIFGECDVADFKDVVQVSCGNWHTVVLHKDGKLSSCGSNENSQCDTEKITKKAIKVSCGRYHTAVLNDDGTVSVLGKLVMPKQYNEMLDKMEDLDSGSIICEEQFDSNDKVDTLKVGQQLKAKYISCDGKCHGETTIRVYDSNNNEVVMFYGEDFYQLTKQVVTSSNVSIDHIIRIEGRRKYARLGIKFEQKKNKSIVSRLDTTQQTEVEKWQDIVDIYSIYDGIVGKTSKGEYFVCGSIPGDISIRTLFGDFTSEEKAVIKETVDEILDEYNPKDFISEMQSNLGYAIWAAFEIVTLHLLENGYNEDIIMEAQESVESDEFIDTVNIDLMSLNISWLAVKSSENESIMFEFLESLVSNAIEQTDKTDFIDIMKRLCSNVKINRSSFLEIAEIVAQNLKIKEKIDFETIKSSDSKQASNENTIRTENDTDEDDDLSNPQDDETTDSFEIENTVLVKYLGNSKKVKIPEGITKLGDRVFIGKYFVKEIEFPSTIRENDFDSFHLTEWYKKIQDKLIVAHNDIIVNFPVTESKVVFSDNIKAILLVSDKDNLLKDVTIPSGVKTLGYAFENSKNLKSITLSEGIEELNKSFAGCSKIEKITLPSTLKKLYFTFFGCSNLKSIELPNALLELGAGSFNGCKRLEDISFNHNLNIIGSSAFEGCISLTNVELPDSVTELGFAAFKGCTALESICLPKGLKELKNDAFRGCTKLKNIVIPDSLETIGNDVFTGCTALKAAMRKKGYDTKNITAKSLKSYFKGVDKTSDESDQETKDSLKKIFEINDKLVALKEKLLGEAPEKDYTAVVLVSDKIDGVTLQVTEMKQHCNNETSMCQFIKENDLVTVSELEESLKDIYEQFKTIYANFSNSWKEENTKQTNVNSVSNSSTTSTANNNSGGCYVATCVYGSYNCPQVWTLRRFRDYTLAKTWHGRTFIYIYYALAPTAVKLFGKTKWFNKMWKSLLDKKIQKLNDDGVENTPYQDLN